LKLVFKIFLGLISLLLGLIIVLVTLIDRTPYQEMPYYKEWKSSIKNLNISPVKSKDSLKIGWAKINITPPEPIPLAGYGKRRGKHYKTVHDSVFVRAIFLENSGFKSVLISADLLIIPPTVSELVKGRISETGLRFDQVYLGATHSHNSLGGWYNTLVGKLFAGEYNPKIEVIIADGIIQSIKNASKNTKAATVTFEKDEDRKDIKNRVIKGGKIEPFIRTLTFETLSEKVILTTYAAHSTVLNAATLQLSRDYPGVLVDSLEKSDAAFAMYMAGAVGSMAPIEFGINDFDELNNQAMGVLREIRSENEMEQRLSQPSIYSIQLPLPLRKASPRILKNWALRPWVFKWLFGESPAFIKVLSIGNTLMIGLPCDFSGELMEDLDRYAQSKGLNLIVTSFNGTYAGYITADKHFDFENYETFTMNWFGPYNGAYFSEVVRDIVDRVKV
jgi:neutral ceramidase